MDKKKFNISNLFNGKLFIEAFKQVRVVGLAAFVLLGTLSIFMPIVKLIEENDSASHYPTCQLFDTDAFMWPLLALIFIVAPLMFIMLFNFLTKRSGSDFYHSLPVKHITLFATFATAVMAWVTILSVVYTFILLITTKIALPYYVIDSITIINYIINVIIGCLLMVSTFSIGVSLTGTLTSNVVFSCGVLIIPRLIITVLSYITINYSNSLTGDGHLIFNVFANIPFALISCLFGFDNRPLYNMLILGEHTYYSFGLAIIYLIIGAKLFITRPSEVSTKSFRSKKVFSMLKFFAGFLISLFIIGYTFNESFERIMDSFSYSFPSIMLVITAIVILMFALEAAYSKSIKKGFKGILYAPIIILTDIALIFVMYISVQYYNNEAFDKDDVDYVYAAGLLEDFSSNDYYGEIYYEGDSYLMEVLSNLKITDRYIIDYLVDAYNKDNTYHQNYDNTIVITFDSALYDETRYVYLTDAEISHLIYKLRETDSFKECFNKYPSPNDNIAISCDESTPSQAKDLYKTFLSEIKNLTTEQLIDIALESTDKYDPVDYFYVSLHVNGHLTYFTVPISSLTPETLVQHMNNLNKNSKNRLYDFMNFAEANFNSKNYHINAELYNTSQDSSLISNRYIDTDNSDNKKALLTLLKEAADSDIKFTKEHLKDENYCITKVFFIEYSDVLSQMYGSYYIRIPKDSPITEEYDEDEDFSEYNLIEIYEDEFGNTTHIYEDEYGNRYEEYIPNLE